MELKKIDLEMLNQLFSLSNSYLCIMSKNRPKMLEITKKMHDPINMSDVNNDIEKLHRYDTVKLKGDICIQTLPHFYAEDLNNVMNKDRRREAINIIVDLINGDIEKQKTGKVGLQNLAKSYQRVPKYGGVDSERDIQDKLQNIISMITYLEASRFKALHTIVDMDGTVRKTQKLSNLFNFSKDKQGFTAAALKNAQMFQRQSDIIVSQDFSSSEEGKLLLSKSYDMCKEYTYLYLVSYNIMILDNMRSSNTHEDPISIQLIHNIK